MQPRANPLCPTAMHQQRIGGDQQDFEEHEQVEQITGEEGAVDTHQLKLEQRVETLPALIVATHRIQESKATQHRRDYQ